LTPTVTPQTTVQSADPAGVWGSLASVGESGSAGESALGLSVWAVVRSELGSCAVCTSRRLEMNKAAHSSIPAISRPNSSAQAHPRAGVAFRLAA
jgi:hypothetical protein